MKQVFLLLIFLSVGFVGLNAKPISPAEAQQAAQHFYLSTNNGDIGTIKLDLVQTISTRVYNADLNQLEDVALYYVFNVNQQDGFVMITADDAATPILGYATEGTFDPSIEAVNFIKWAEAYKEEMRFIIENNIQPTPEITEAWENLRRGVITNDNGRSPSTVNPLLGAIKWNQNPGWNSLCPGGSVVGCVATAMAQIMKYWSHPVQGTGFHSYNHSSYGTLSVNYGSTTYNWSAMPNTTSSSESAKLSYHCGVAVDMMYSPSGSGAYSEDAKDAFKNYFGYKSTLQYVARSSYTTTSWKNLLKTDLNASRPLYYAGTGNGGGHAFVCDGYDASDYFHFNWGWGGAYDGYFHIDALNPSGVGTGGGSGGFNSNHRVIKGIEPNTSGGGGGGSVPVSLYLYSNISISPASTITYGQNFTVDVDIANNSGTTFTGDIAAALLDANNSFVSFVETKTNVTYNTGTYSSPTFSSSNMTITPSPGTYKIVLYQKQTGAASWSAVGNGSYSNSKTLVIQTINSGGMNLYAAISSSASPIVLGQPFSVNTNYHNTSSLPFTGKFSIDLHDMQGNFVITIDEKTMSLNPGNVYVNNIVFSSTGLSGLSPGTYQMAAWMQPTGGSWELVGNGSYNNPIQINVVEPTLAADVYENNNSTSSAYSLMANFSGTTATVSTPGANIHNGNDYDYYRLYLPTGYSYFVYADVFDSYNSPSSNYTNDVLFSYDTGLGFSETYDNSSGTIILPNGGTVIFKVASYYQGQTGTYKFQAVANRGTVSVEKIEEASTWNLYPNPAKDVLYLEFESTDGLEQLEVYNTLGQKIYAIQPTQEQIQQISTQDWNSGTYWLLIYKEGIITRKSFVVTR